MRPTHQFEHEVGIALRYTRQRVRDKFVEEMAVMLSPVFDSLRETEVILGGFAQRTAYDLGPPVCRLKHVQDGTVGERHPQRLCEVADVGGIERQAAGVAENGTPLQDETPYVKGDPGAARD